MNGMVFVWMLGWGSAPGVKRARTVLGRSKKRVQYDERGYRVGETHHRAKLTDEDVEHMRVLHEDYGISISELARKFECGVSTASEVCNYKTRASTPVKMKELVE